jgi:isoleucyl-tRNA synthetase
MSIDFPKAEEAIIERWREIKAFERQVSNPASSVGNIF